MIMPRLKTRALALFVGCGFVFTYLAASLLHHRSSREELASHNVLSLLRQIYNANESVLPTQSTVILEPSPGLTCRDQGAGLHLLFMVISSPDKADARDGIRNTFQEMRHKWENDFFQNLPANHTSNTTRVFQVLFFVGQAAHKDLSDELRSEWERHGDLVVDDMHESYLNLTVKTLRMLKWALHNCAHANYLVKIDDDVFVQVPLLLAFLAGHGSPTLVAGHRYNEVSVVRDPSSKWYTPPGLWHRDKFPVFVAGFCYVMGMRAATVMFAESRRVPLFHLEDVFLSGIVATERLGLELSQMGDIVTMVYWYHYLKPLHWTRDKMLIHGISSRQLHCLAQYTSLNEEEQARHGDSWPLLFTCPY